VEVVYLPKQLLWPRNHREIPDNKVDYYVELKQVSLSGTHSLTYSLTHSLHLFIFFSTVDHAKGGVERLDATITYDDESHESIVFAHESEDYDHDAWFSAYTPQEEDGCYIGDSDALKTGTDAGKVLTHSLTYSLTHSLTH
jgi:hypothetical protein